MFEQFSGYFDLEDIDLKNYSGRSVPMDVVLGRERTQHSQVLKQADVVALLGLLPEEFEGDSAVKNFRYYSSRCGHGSSLSPAMHGLVAARLGDTATALRFFRLTAAIDLSAKRQGSAGGIHIAAQGGIWMLSVLGFAGLAYAATAYPSIRIFPSGGTVLPSAFSGVVGTSRLVSISLNDVSMQLSRLESQ